MMRKEVDNVEIRRGVNIATGEKETNRSVESEARGNSRFGRHALVLDGTTLVRSGGKINSREEHQCDADYEKTNDSYFARVKVICRSRQS